MKRNEVPQDEALFGKFHEITYAVDDEGSYSQEKSKGWDPKTIALSQYWKLVQEQVEETVEQVRTGKLSPLAYFMTVRQMDLGLMADYVGLFKWRVKRHLKPKVFAKLPDDVLQKYADTFKITTNELQTLPPDAEKPACVCKWADLRE